MKPADVKLGTCIDSSKENMKKILNLNLVKSYIPKEVFVIKKVKMLCRCFRLLVILTAKKLWERFTKMYYKNQIKKSLESKK